MLAVAVDGRAEQVEHGVAEVADPIAVVRPEPGVDGDPKCLCEVCLIDQKEDRSHGKSDRKPKKKSQKKPPKIIILKRHTSSTINCVSAQRSHGQKREPR